jgi:ABC-2 type transport system permease protein
MRAIYKRELRSLFTSMIAYIFIAVYLLIFGIYFRYYNLSYGVATIGFPTLYYSNLSFLLFAILTMKSLPEERREKIDQLLYTSPVSVVKIVLGKYLAMCTVFFVVIAVMASTPLVLKSIGYSMLKVDYTSLLAYFLLGCVYIALCMFISSLTESQIISAILSIIAIFILEYFSSFSDAISTEGYVSMLVFIIFAIIIGVIFAILSKNSILGTGVGIGLSLIILLVYIFKKDIFTGAIQKVFAQIPPSNYLINFIYYYMFDVKAIVYYLSVICLFVFLTVQTIQKRRYS